MPTTIELKEVIDDNPIILVTITGKFTKEDVYIIYEQTANYLEEYSGTVYRVHDIRKGEFDFATMMNVIREAQRGTPGNSASPRVQVVMVGTNASVDMARDYIGRMKDRSIPAFRTLEDAMDAIKIGMIGMPGKTDS